jgi:hypothetical protein
MLTGSIVREGAVYASLRKYRGVRRPAEVARRIEGGLDPLLRAMAGFHSYHLFHGGDGTTTISLFETEETATASAAVASAWTRENLADLCDGEPREVTGGKVFVAIET